MHTIPTSIYWVSDVEHMGSKEQFTACTTIFFLDVKRPGLHAKLTKHLIFVISPRHS